VVVVGAGAAGLLCAIEAAKRGRRVAVLEHNPRIGRKILISGGGRCNFTNLRTAPENFLSANPHFAKSALARYAPRDFVRLVERHGIPYHEKAAGQLFCDRSAGDITGMLEAECAAAGVRVETGCAVRGVAHDGRFRIETARGEWQAGALVVATGGLSVPKTGATAFGYDLARQFGLRVVECRPALVPLTFSRADREWSAPLAGVSAECSVAVAGRVFREKLLFTHRGLSGPAILQASSYWQAGDPLQIDLLPGADLAALLRGRRGAGDGSEARTIAAGLLPRRLAEAWFERFATSKPAASLSDRDIQAVAAAFQQWRPVPACTEGYEKAEVTAGGVVDVTGQLGGFNFQWAWASGYSAGQAV